jgi:hypothetical protein
MAFNAIAVLSRIVPHSNAAVLGISSRYRNQQGYAKEEEPVLSGGPAPLLSGRNHS